MATALDIISDAMVEIGAYMPGETLASAHQQLGLLRFQNQLDAWQTDRLSLNLQDRDVFTLTSGTSTFTIGPAGNLNTARPVYIQGMNYIIPGTTPATEVPMGQMDDDSFLSLSQKGLQASLPQMFYYNATFTPAAPWGTMFIWPTVTQNVDLAIYLPRGIDVPASLTTLVGGPQGYAEAFIYQLALRLCGPMARPIPDGLPEMAAASYARMRRPNEEPGQLGVDPALVLSYGGGFNVLTGTMAGPLNR